MTKDHKSLCLDHSLHTIMFQGFMQRPTASTAATGTTDFQDTRLGIAVSLNSCSTLRDCMKSQPGDV